MAALEPTPERIAAARRASGRDWTFGPEGAVEIATDPVLGEMVCAGLITPYYVPSGAHLYRDDYYALTETGRKWLARVDEEG